MKQMACVMVVLALVGVGCGKAKQAVGDKATELAIESAAKPEGKNVDVKVNSSSGSVQMTQTTDGGKTTAAYGEGTKMPADWPKDIPVPDGLALVTAQSTPEQGQFMITGTTAQPLDKVVAFIKEKIPAQGWKVETTMAVPGQTDTTIFKKDDRNLNVTANVEDGKTAIVLSVSK